ncbi:SDR family oxidoreductase [Capnocytophaga sp. 051621]|jgi:2-deoxy-D-gluconate 3-dehydrogenase|uniref:SDR family oxidoreductase n=2 Tax=Capnocytophaga TaxID=1016 RepID=A0ABS1YYG4_9FLAO|nr:MULTISPECIES: SDR family oxidoreductase [Capnocytophaga]MBI1647722.1 SDR family oxidoreductase [Capnocytophaga periodontitidis]MBM0651456.1 SDR family oxidoreductase [Capnocytophaga genosp. AHN8471]MBM0662944.1 SDR family oxidoreductase [Capnocytophaga genosp. AHN8471]
MYNPFSLKNKTVLVTGASSGIGKAIAIECSKMGAQVVITGRNEQRLQETYKLLEGLQPAYIVADLTKKEDIETLVNQIDSLNGLVNCAGLTIPKPFKFLQEEDIQQVMTVNFNAPLLLTQLLVKKKKLQKTSSIVFISSISGTKVSYIGNSIYSASKGAINGICKGLALELASQQIRVNTITPGMVETNIVSGGEVTQEQMEADKQKYPLKRYGKPEEVAYAVVYLLSEASSWVTGSNLLIDGGYTLL